MGLFLRLGKIAAWLILIYAVIRIGMGLYVAETFVSPEANQAASRRYLATETSGEAIDSGLNALLGAIALGILVSIAQALTRPRRKG